ncbi:hypothetical protein [Peredibacter starrii]|uniref:Uncharacterized protein n=1 Tax=Peredibacter starrii TaxID=28202 RepID=A0AAX4HJ87_9BACT|nr:hypothetical protein [Peredibacter starrii]WPU63284.1 hypothetical protein SOO65_11365 [Peredibacter starrii]
MKTILSITLMLLAVSAFAQAPKHNYQCIADSLQAYNSDIYYALTPAEIDELLASQDDARAPMVREMAKVCDVPNYQSKQAIFVETAGTEIRDNVVVEKILSTTELSVIGQERNVLTLKTTKATRWNASSKFIDIKMMTVAQTGDVQVIEVDGNNMGRKVTNLKMDCVAEKAVLRCASANYKLIVK